MRVEFQAPEKFKSHEDPNRLLKKRGIRVVINKPFPEGETAEERIDAIRVKLLASMNTRLSADIRIVRAFHPDDIERTTPLIEVNVLFHEQILGKTLQRIGREIGVTLVGEDGEVFVQGFRYTEVDTQEP